jgi:hypothetical protein
MTATQTQPWADPAALGQLVYRSAAAAPLGREHLHHLLDQARTRNAAESLTGLLVYDQGRFVQWLEGPAANVERVWNSIQRDPRHAEIERLHTPWHPERLFPDWQMKFAALPDGGGADDELTMSEAVMKGLRNATHTVADFMDGVAFWQALPTTRQMLATLVDPDDAAFESLIGQRHRAAQHVFGQPQRRAPAALGHHGQRHLLVVVVEDLEAVVAP